MLSGIFSRLKIITVEPVVFMFAICVAIETNSVQELMLVKCCLKLNHTTNLSDCNLHGQMSKEIKNEVASWMKYYNLAMNLTSLFLMFFLGSWNDRYGSKATMLIPCIGALIVSIVNVTLSVYIFVPIEYLFVSAFVSGSTGGLMGVIVLTYSYTSDCGTKRTRSARLIFLDAMQPIGTAIGSYLAGQFVKNISIQSKMNGLASIFFFRGTVCVCLILYVTFILKSIERERMLFDSFTCCKVFKPTHVIDSLKAVFRSRDQGKRAQIILLLLALTFAFLKHIVFHELGYLQSKSLDWSFEKYSNFYSMLSISSLIGQFIGFFVFSYTAATDYTIGIVGSIFRSALMAMFGLSTSNAMVYICIPLDLLAEWPLSALRSMLSKTVDDNDKGKIFAASGIVESITYLVGNYMMLTLFTATFNGFCFLLSAGLQLITLFIIIYLRCKRTNLAHSYETIENGSVNTEVCDTIADEDNYKDS